MKTQPRIAIILGRGVEGCGVTRYVIEEQAWYRSQKMVCDVYASTDKLWPRRLAQPLELAGTFDAHTALATAKKIDENYDIVYFQSWPSKNHSQLFCTRFLQMMQEIVKPVKIAHQNDHKIHSINRNYKMFELLRNVDATFTFTKTCKYATMVKEFVPELPIMTVGNGFNFDGYKKMWRPFEEKKKCITYFGRFATFKDPQRLVDHFDKFKKANIAVEMRGVERSLGSLKLFYEDPAVRDKQRDCIFEVHPKNGIVEKHTKPIPKDKLLVYGPYTRMGEDGLPRLAESMFGADFYHLDASYYGENMMEYSMAEAIAVGTVGVFDSHWIKHCAPKLAAISCDREDMAATVTAMKHLAHKDIYEKYRTKAWEQAREMCDSNVVFKKMHNAAMTVTKL